MSELIVVSVRGASAAFALRDDLRALGREFFVEAEDIAVVTHDTSGKVRLHQEVNRVAAQAIGGGIWGLVLGAVFLMPIAGAAVGAGVGAVAGRWSDAGIDDAFLRRIGRGLAPGTAAVGLLARRVAPEQFAAVVEAHRGRVIRAALSEQLGTDLSSLVPDGIGTRAHVAKYRQQPTL